MPSGKTTQYQKFLRTLFLEAEKTGQPLEASFEITHRCNLSCGMCYVRNLQAADAAASKELSASTWVNIARDATDAGLLFLLITGGEPLLRKDFLDIYNPLTELGLHLMLYTNGTLVNSEVAKRLAERPPFRLEVSVYGASEATYGKVTGSSEAFVQFRAGVDALKAAGATNLLLKSPLSVYNVQDLPAMRQMAKEWDIPFSPSWMLTRRRDRSPSSIEDYRLPPGIVAALQDEDDVIGWSSDDSLDRMQDPGTSDALFCDAGKTSFVVDSQGVMMPCMDLPELATYPLTTGFSAAWSELKSMTRAIPHPIECTAATCEHHADCPWCPGMSYLETGNYTSKVAYACDIADSRARLRERTK